MSKPTLQERAVDYMGNFMGGVGGHWKSDDQRDEWVERHLAQFAAQEVARVREAQRWSVRDLLLWADKSVWAEMREAVSESAHRIDAATRPERPARAKAVYLCSKPLDGLPDCNNVLDHKGRCGWTALREPKGGVVTDVNHKPVRTDRIRKRPGDRRNCPGCSATGVVSGAACGVCGGLGTVVALAPLSKKERGLSTLAKAAKKGKRP